MERSRKKEDSTKSVATFFIRPRLKRMFATKEASESAQWHNVKRQPSEKEMNHLADGEAWHDFDREFPNFAKDARSLRLGLATDSFNPFRKRTQNTSCGMCLWCHITFHPRNAWKSQTSL
jgi:hypothetical protein